MENGWVLEDRAILGVSAFLGFSLGRESRESFQRSFRLTELSDLFGSEFLSFDCIESTSTGTVVWLGKFVVSELNCVDYEFYSDNSSGDKKDSVLVSKIS